MQIEPDTLRAARCQNGTSLYDLSQEKPVLLVFLRHFGCTFCREAMADIAQRRDYLTEKGILPAFVHMVGETEAAENFRKYGLERVPRFSDPDKHLYRAFGLKRGTFRQLLGPRVWLRGFRAAILEGHWFGGLQGDGLQMPGIFLLHQGQIKKDFRHQTAADRPAYERLADCSDCR